MNGPHLHLVLNHLPVVGSVLVAVLLLVAIFRAEPAIRRLALVALLGVALLGFPAYFTGEPAEEGIEHLAGVEEPRIEKHEDMAKVALAGLSLAGVIALAALVVFRRREIPTSLLVVALVVDLGAAALLARVATLGGEIRHPEIRAGTTAPPGPTDAAPRTDDD